MKKLLVMACMMFGCTIGAKATGDKATKALASARAKHLSDKMIRGLHLNNYQSRKIREINMQVAEQMTAIEQQYAGNQAKIDELCKGVCAERDKYLENVLSTVQYNDYFGNRKVYNEIDQEFVANATQDQMGNSEIASAPKASDNATVSVN